jgi:hypothetical protein
MIWQKESVSLNVCGVLTSAHCESSNSGASNPATSSSGFADRKNRQSALKSYVSRGESGGENCSRALASAAIKPTRTKAVKDRGVSFIKWDGLCHQ